MKIAPLPRLFPLERTLALSDGVFAVVITLLVLGIEVPQGGGSVAEVALMREKLAHQVLVYFVAFWIVAMYWSQHAILFATLRRMDGVMVLLNLALLLPVSLLPFVTQLMGENHTHWAPVGVFASVNLFAAFVLGRAWHHVLARPAFHEGAATVALASRIRLGLRVFVGLLLVGTLVALVNVKAGILCFVVTPFAHFLKLAHDALRAEPEPVEARLDQ